ncbi:MAG: hypothetical protein U0X39_00035 [Bacteroidales bacterium]
MIVPLLGYLVLFYKEIVTERYFSFRFWMKKKTDPAFINDLVERRKRIREMLGF